MLAAVFRFIQKVIWICGIIVLFSTICWDLDRSDGGYIRPIFSYLSGLFLSVRAEVVEISDTPLASLTIAKIFKLIWYCCVGWFICVVIYWIWSIGNDLLEIRREKVIEHEGKMREEKEDEKFDDQSREECAEMISRMQSASNQMDLDLLLFEAIEKWPKWEKQLSKVYEERKAWLKKNTPD